MKLGYGKAYFSSASEWGALIAWLKKKGKRPTSEPWIIEDGLLVQNVEDRKN